MNYENYDGGQAAQYAAAPLWYGGPEKLLHVTERRRMRLRILPAIVALLVPWTLYGGLSALLCFSFRFYHPFYTWAVVAGWAFVLALLAVYTLVRRQRLAQSGEKDPSWLLFMLLTMSLAWAAGVIAGDYIFEDNLKLYYERHVLDNYVGVNPSTWRGQEMMDAGTVVFDSDAMLDVSKSMGFRHTTVYCVAPISIGNLGNSTLATYDFWAVGQDCCSGLRADFRCDGFADSHYSGGLRLMNDNDQAYYKLAVEQAEATYKIQALHPLFFVWVRDAPATVENWFYKGREQYFTGLFGSFLVQALLVTFACLGFARLKSPLVG